MVFHGLQNEGGIPRNGVYKDGEFTHARAQTADPEPASARQVLEG
jgi:hypothetical protein